MMLLLDAGNTRLKWAVHDGAAIRDSGALDYGELDELRRTAAALAPASKVVGVNVAGQGSADAIAAVLEPLGLVPEWNLSCRDQCGVRNSYEQAGQLGADRWAALIGARALHRGPVVVVMAGTATTVDLLDETGVFLGGLIFPGFDLMRGSLARNTAQLPYADGCYTAQPRRTADAIFSGCLHAQAGAVERLFAQFAIHPAAKCLVGGGGAELLLGALSVPREFQPHLVLHGLARIGLESRQSPG